MFVLDLKLNLSSFALLLFFFLTFKYTFWRRRLRRGDFQIQSYVFIWGFCGKNKELNTEQSLC